MIARLLREPLLQFLLLGALLFVAFDLVGGKRSASAGTVVVDEQVVAAIGERFAATWQRPPTADELQGLVEQWVRDEIAYREGLALGLDRDDTIVRRRVRQKLDVLAEESVRAAPPTDAELQAFLAAQPGRYAAPPAIAFEQVVVEVPPGAAADAALQRARARLDAGEPAAAVSASRLLPVQLPATPLDLVARRFGTGFAEALDQLPPGAWQGPVRSGYGLHLVRVAERVPGRAPTLDEVRTAVARDFEKERRDRAAEAFYRQLRSRYEVRIETGAFKAAAP
ncbi:MAG: peptidyl-prolyl cis-trans isomerase [Burkholderiales bacterium]|nr:peptidyl-prolyl cis-trans isomerase [Burkholderiales bacterium]